MKILKLAKQLKKIHDLHGDIDVLFADPNSNTTDPYDVDIVQFREVKYDSEYPGTSDMKTGFKFVLLLN